MYSPHEAPPCKHKSEKLPLPPITRTREAQMELSGTRPGAYGTQRHTLTLKCVTLTPFAVCNVTLTLKCVTFVTFVTL